MALCSRTPALMLATNHLRAFTRAPVTTCVRCMHAAAASTSSSASDAPPLRSATDGGVRLLTLNRPRRYNAFNSQLFAELPAALHAAAEDDDVRAVVLTGTGPFYSSGNDLADFMTSLKHRTPAEAAAQLRAFVDAFIDFPKVLIGAVNGPAIGIGATTLALCDVVHAANHAYFHTPFTALGQSPEACSSFLFPTLLGRSLANEVLLMGRKLTAVEARDAGLVAAVHHPSDLMPRVQAVAAHVASLPPGSVMDTRAIVRGADVERLKAVNAQECELLERRWASAECAAALAAFASRKQ